MQVYEIQSGPGGPDSLILADHPEPMLQAGQVLVKMHAAALNYRDLQVLRGTYGVQPTVPLSDGAGEIVATAKDVTRWQVGDRVTGIFRQTFISGELTPENAASALGGETNGVLVEFKAFDQQGLVKIPDHLSYEEAATLPCAAVTAWNALITEGQLKAGETVLLLGRGGVSVFALQFAKLVGAKVFITSGTNEKLKQAYDLGADVGINYNTTPRWDIELQALTNGRGLDNIVELGGSATLPKSLRAAGYGGKIELVGVISGTVSELDITLILGKRLRIQGISVGSRDSFEEMNRAIVQQKMRPIIDRVFPFKEAKAAMAYLERGAHFGKVVVTI